MSGKEAPVSQWLKNFTASVSSLIEEQKSEGYQIKAIILTEGLHKKLCEAHGYEVSDMLGYVINILEQNEEELAEEGQMVLISGDPLN